MQGFYSVSFISMSRYIEKQLAIKMKALYSDKVLRFTGMSRCVYRRIKIQRYT
jgi:hypothetical protein